MRDFDWRELYALNQATIAASGIGLPEMAPAPLPAMRVPPAPPADPDRLPNLLRGRGPATTPSLRRPSSPLAPGGNPSTGARALVHVGAGLDPEAPAAVVCMLHGC